MKEEKNIDRSFRDKLENFSLEPPAHIWTGIQDQLMRNKKRRRILYLRWISAAAAILLAFLGGWYFSNNTETQQAITAEETINQPNEAISKGKVITETDNIPFKPETNLIASSAEQKETKTEKQTVASFKPEEKVSVTATQNRKRETLILKQLESREPNFNFSRKTEIKLPKTRQISVPENGLTEPDRMLIASNTADFRSGNSDESRWKFGMMVSPGYSSQVANHSQSYASNMTYSANSGNTNVTGGISVQMRTSKRLSVESGVYYDKNGQKSGQALQLFDKRNDQMYTNPVGDYYSNNIDMTDNHLSMNSVAGIITLDKLPDGAEISGDIESSALGASNEFVASGDLSQVFDFIQIPLYLRYKLIDSRVDVEMIGGFNAGMLVGNNAYIDNEYGLQNIGETQDISPLSFSGTLGIGLSYKLGTHISLGAEPRLNYFLSSINKNSDITFKPYRIGFYTGVYYEF